MSGTSIVAGILLVVIGATGYGYGMNAGNASVTALIPAFFGIVLIVCGGIATVVEGMRRHLMHLAVVIALLGFILTAGRLVMKAATGGLEASAAVVSQGAMALVCLVFVVLAIRSFAAARSNESK
jgi:hypothetical protein